LVAALGGTKHQITSTKPACRQAGNKQAPKGKFQSPKRLAPNARAAKQFRRLGEDKRSRDARLEFGILSLVLV
jgi:hypothetical protein